MWYTYICIYNGILFNLKKEGNSDTCYNMDKLWRHYAKQRESQKDKYCMIPLICDT